MKQIRKWNHFNVQCFTIYIGLSLHIIDYLVLMFSNKRNSRHILQQSRGHKRNFNASNFSSINHPLRVLCEVPVGKVEMHQMECVMASPLKISPSTFIKDSGVRVDREANISDSGKQVWALIESRTALLYRKDKDKINI